MTGVVANLTGATAKKAEKAQAMAREQSGVAQARQLSTMAAETSRTALTRKNPRGRRLLADAGASQLPTTVA